MMFSDQKTNENACNGEVQYFLSCFTNAIQERKEIVLKSILLHIAFADFQIHID